MPRAHGKLDTAFKKRKAKTCVPCDGRGYIAGNPIETYHCNDCNGSGRIDERFRFYHDRLDRKANP